MPKLTFLTKHWTAEQKQLFDNAVLELEKHGIVDDVAFLKVEDMYTLSKTTELPLPILAALQQKLISNMGYIDHRIVDTSTRYIRTPFRLLNTCLSGGLRLDDMVEVTSGNPQLLGKFFIKLVEGFTHCHPRGKVVHIDTIGRFQSRLIHHPKMPLSQIECNTAFTVPAINQLLERYGALTFASRRRQHDDLQPTLIVIEDIGYMLDSAWDTAAEQVDTLHQIILQLKSMDICIVVSHCTPPNTQRRNDINWNNSIDMQLSLSSSGGEPIANIIKARHVKTPQRCSLST